MSGSPADCDVVVIGGGASGALMALHLLNHAADLRIVLIERSAVLGCGVAYSTTDPDHLLNTRVHNMSAYPDQPDHFLDWLQSSGQRPEATPDSFVARPLYGTYLSELLASRRARPPETGQSVTGRSAPGGSETGRPGADQAATGQSGTDQAAPEQPALPPVFGPGVNCLQGACLEVTETPEAVQVRLEDGRHISAHRAILATGHATASDRPEGLTSAWDFSPPASLDDDILIIGTGLSMVDHVMTLLRRGHRGRITCVSRRGLLPREHRPGSPLPTAATEVPFGQPVSKVLRWLRHQARRAVDQGGSWRDAIDGLRPHVAPLWQSWPLAERRRFLRHAASWWDVYRHRMPPRSASNLSKAAERGQFRSVRGRFEGITADQGRWRVTLRDARGLRDLTVDRVIDCRGIRRNPATDSDPVIRTLLERGHARLDALNLGLDTTLDARLINGDGQASARIYAIGPCARGALWEITAIPDIRLQCAAVAAAIVSDDAAAGA